MESARWHDEIYTMKSAQWNPHTETRTMEFTQWNPHDGIRTMESARPYNGTCRYHYGDVTTFNNAYAL